MRRQTALYNITHRRTQSILPIQLHLCIFFFLILDCACIQHDLFSVFMKKRGPLGLSLTPSIVHTSSASNLTF